MTWHEMSVDCRRAAQHLLDKECLRSSISRSYYAAYAAVASKLDKAKVSYPAGRGNPRHADMLRYIQNSMRSLSADERRSVRRIFRYLWLSRVEADYIPSASFDRNNALNALRNAKQVMRIMGLE